MTVAHKPVTAEELLLMPEDGVRRELVEGEMNLVGSVHGRIAAHLFQHVENHELGAVLAAETGFKISSNPDTVRAPDVAFVRRERIEEVGKEVEGYWPGAPDPAAEVVSLNGSYASVEEKFAAWPEAGTRAVVVVEPWTRTLTMRSSRTEIRVLTEGDVLDVGEVGWTLPVADVFG